MMKNILVIPLIFLVLVTVGQDVSKFKQLQEELPTPNVYRTGSGAPGPKYWQQRCDYDISVTLVDSTQMIFGNEVLTYYNNSPEALTYIWVQLDQNLFEKSSHTYLTETGTLSPAMDFLSLQKILPENREGGHKIEKVEDLSGKPLNYLINNTMMRVDLPKPLTTGNSYKFRIQWHYKITDQLVFGGRSGYEYFSSDQNYLYEIAQFFPRVCLYTDYTGWQNKQFLGDAEFTLPFGNYKVAITVPSDHIVTATGTLQNPDKVLTKEQRNRLKEASNSDKPVFIITPEEAKKNEQSRAKTTSTWIFKAENVRDFAFASSRKFIWDAMNVSMNKGKALAMSLYPNEAMGLWDKFATYSVAHALKFFSEYTGIDYPYPVAIAVHGPVFGMEYPMISFNGARPNSDGSYSERLKYTLISVIIHEVGHNFFPMIVNSDERQWAWMDEGLNSFVQYLAEQAWTRDYPSRRGPASSIINYMKSDPAGQQPIMTNPESITQLGNNAYGKVAAALNILRETVMGRKLFDEAFKEYCRRWAFKTPTPADFFRTMEDASAVDLDWFWREWFFNVGHVDQTITNVTGYTINKQDPEKELPEAKQKKESEKKDISSIRNSVEIKATVLEQLPFLMDKYDSITPYEVTEQKISSYKLYYNSLNNIEKAILESNNYFYQVDLANVGTMVMPVILQLQFVDGTEEVIRIPAEIWRKNEKKVSKVIACSKEVKQFVLDPFLEIADVDASNNTYQGQINLNKIVLYKK
ncbi:MAG TPA: M1 family metallopeptidase [Cytophagaceae bacterium]